VHIIKYIKEKNPVPTLDKKKNRNINKNTKHNSAIIALRGKMSIMDRNKITASINIF